MLREQADAAGVAVGKTLTYGGGGGALVFGLSAHEIAAYSGIVGMLLGLLLQFYFNHRRDARETADRRERREEYEARMKRWADGRDER